MVTRKTKGQEYDDGSKRVMGNRKPIEPVAKKARPQVDDDTTSIVELEEGLRIDEHALEQALMSQPETFYRVGKRYQLLVSQRDAKKQEIAELEARADRDIRDTALKHEDKVTETEVKNLVKLDPDIKRASNELLDIQRVLGSLSALKEAFEHRSKALDGLVRLYLANYYGANTDGSRVAQSMLREGSSNRVRAELREQRRVGYNDG